MPRHTWCSHDVWCSYDAQAHVMLTWCVMLIWCSGTRDAHMMCDAHMMLRHTWCSHDVWCSHDAQAHVMLTWCPASIRGTKETRKLCVNYREIWLQSSFLTLDKHVNAFNSTGTWKTVPQNIKYALFSHSYGQSVRTFSLVFKSKFSCHYYCINVKSILLKRIYS